LWFAVGGEERTETTLSIPLEFVNLPGDKIITSEVPPNLQVRISGPRSIIRNLSQSRQIYSLDLAGIKAGKHSYPIGPQSFPFPRGVVVSRVQPNPINLTLVNVATRLLPIHPALTGNLQEGYEVKSVTTRPDHVYVKGPASELEGLKAVSTLPIDLTNLAGPATLATDLDFKSLHLTLKDQVPILADVTIAPKTLARKISGLPLSAGPAARIVPDKVNLTLQGPWPQVKNLKPEDLKVIVDTGNLKPGRHRLKVSVQLPPALRLEKVEPAEVSVFIKK
jgi:YbbR domain-containing protein